jgi:hypothetical protein
MGRVETIAALGRLVPAAGGTPVPQTNGYSLSPETITALTARGNEGRTLAPVKEMLELIAGATNGSKVKVRFEIEVEPMLKT